MKTLSQISALQEPLFSVEGNLLSHQVHVEAWFRQQWQKTRPPIYCSVDLRNSGYKLAPVDTNLFPAGFNNLNPDFMPLYVQAVSATIAEICPDVKRLLIIPESHSRNIFYFESVAILKEIFHKAGFEVRIGSLDPELHKTREYNLPSGKNIKIEPLIRREDCVGVGDFFSCCIILNNDLSTGIPDILQNLSQTIMPPVSVGWWTRLKSEHFRFFQEVVAEFSEAFQFDPWIVMPFFEQCPAIDFMKKEGETCLIERAEILLERIKRKYKEYAIKQPPFLVIKADQGTYGMAVMMIKDPQELHALNRKQRTRMSTLKGGLSVTKAIIQEGVYTFETIGEDSAVAEPVIYMIGRHVVGGFYRVHKEKGIDENLNSPGMNFSPMPFNLPCNMPSLDCAHPSNRFYLYGVVARLALLAAARELAAFEKG